MQPAIRFHRDECIDLPPCIYETRQVEMTPAQNKAYKDMLAKLVAEVEDGQISAVNDGVKAAKLLQISKPRSGLRTGIIRRCTCTKVATVSGKSTRSKARTR